MSAVVADCCGVQVGFWIRVGISYRPLVCGRAHSGHSSCLALGPSKTLQRLYCRTMANDEELSQALIASCFERLTSPFHIHIDRGSFLWFFHFLSQLAREWNLPAAGHVIQNPSMKGCLFQFLLGVPRPYSKKNRTQKNRAVLRKNIPRPYSMRQKTYRIAATLRDQEKMHGEKNIFHKGGALR